MEKLDRIRLRLQMALGYAAAFFLAPLYFLGLKMMGYRIRDLKAMRKTCRKLFANHEGPWIICANHLTMIDSLILTYAMASLPGHLVNYKRLPWNLPERDNFQRNPILAVLCYLAKCIPVNRGGNREKMKRALAKCSYLLDKGHSLMIFPEGGRSRTGRVDTDNFSYGVGRFIEGFPSARVLCLYLRGDRQASHSIVPRWGERFYVAAEALVLERDKAPGLRGQRDLAEQVIRKLSLMEEAYFARHRQRYCGSHKYRGEREEEGYSLYQPRPYL